MDDQRVILPGSEPKHEKDTCWSPVSPQQCLTVTIYLRRNPTDASTEDLQAIQSFAQQHGLHVVDENMPARAIRLAGTIEQLSSAFDADIGEVESKNGSYISYKGPLTLPESLKDLVIAVLGLDQRPIARYA